MTDTLWIRRQRLSRNRGFALGAKTCTTDAGTCCGTTSSCLPTGVSALKREKRRLHLPPGARLGTTWCEDITLCCAGSGSGSSGRVTTSCCSNSISESLVVTITHPGGSTCTCLDGTYTLNWDGGTSRWQGTFTACGKTITIRIRCSNPSLPSFLFELICDGSDLFVHDFSTNTCSPFALSGFFSAIDTRCGCAFGQQIKVDVAEAGGGSGGSSCAVRLTKRRVYVPRGITLGSPYCLANPDACCEDSVTLSCCTRPFPKVMYLTVTAVHGLTCTCLHAGDVFPVRWVGGAGGNVWRCSVPEQLDTAPHSLDFCFDMFITACPDAICNPDRFLITNAYFNYAYPTSLCGPALYAGPFQLCTTPHACLSAVAAGSLSDGSHNGFDFEITT